MTTVLSLPRRLAGRPRLPEQRSRPMRLVRRAHLFTGLFLAPWVLLYGFTAFVFNHPALTPSAERELTRAELEQLWPASAVDAEDLARELVLDLRARAPDLEPCDPPPSLTGRFVFQGADQAQRHTLAFDAADARGLWRTSPVDPQPEQPTFLAGFDAAAASAWVPRAAAQRLLGALGLQDERLRLREAPILRFGVHDGQRAWVIEHDAAEGELHARPAEDPAPGLDALDFLLHLHTTHGRTGAAGARWGWSWIVDAMAVCMVGWALTGLAMWWQLPRQRRAGLYVLVACAGLAGALAVGMHAELLP